MNFSLLALLPNEKSTKIILDEENQTNYISQAIVDILLQTDEIFVDGDQTFVEFHLKVLGRTQKKSVNYFDGVWCTIDSSSSYITLGKEWLEERHVAIDSNQCIIQPPHLRGKFCFPKYISTVAKPVPPKKTVIDEKPLELVTIADHLCVETIFVDIWDQDLFVESGLHLICDDVFEISPSLMVTSDLQDFTRDQCNYDMIWSDLDAHILGRLQLFRRLIGLDILLATLLVRDFIILLPLVWILRHFKTRGRVFSNQGRMMGSEKLKPWFNCSVSSSATERDPRRVRREGHAAKALSSHLLPPLRYGKGGYLFLPSYIMRTHGAKQQQAAVRSVPRKQLQRVFEALDTLGDTKWRVNNRVLNVVEAIWKDGGCIAGLVDCKDVPIPEKPDSEDATEMRKWKWAIRRAKKVNIEMYAQRCDTELKLSVRFHTAGYPSKI
ncbi:hypothetical protein Taro_048187 [Colocasia esculenta]|uniref:DNA-directed RNA polymerase n=1 Tax=Colocasia esculenta TaxID=4460 RepID=A0A843X795_COLES|nr:hypothetical protein [Colocasia esculenta]